MTARRFPVAQALVASGTSEGARKAHQTMGHVAGGKRFAKAKTAPAGKYAHLTAAQRAAADKLAADYQALPKGTKATFDKVSAGLRAQGVTNPIDYLADHADRRDAAAQAAKPPAEIPFLDDEAARIAADDQFDKEWDEAWDGELDTESKLPRRMRPHAAKGKPGKH